MAFADRRLTARARCFEEQCSMHIFYTTRGAEVRVCLILCRLIEWTRVEYALNLVDV